MIRLGAPARVHAFSCGLGLVLLAGAIGSFGCAADPSDEATGSDEDALTASRVGVEGDLTIGRPAHLDSIGLGKRYRALRFTANAGDRLAIVATASEGDPVAYVLDAQKKTLATNDDGAPGQRESFIAFDVPADGTYFVAVRNKGATVVEHTIGVRYRPSSGAYRFPGTCRTTSGFGVRSVELHADFQYNAGNIAFRGLGYTPASDVPGDLASLLINSYSTRAAHALEPTVGFGGWSNGGTVYPWSESASIILEVDAGKLVAMWSRSGATISNDRASCEFNTSAVFAAPATQGSFPTSLEGQTLIARGTCRGSNLVSTMCVAGTSGRGPDGCCATGQPLGPTPSELAFKVSSSNGVSRLELVSATGAGRTISLSERSVTPINGGFRVDDASIPFYTTALTGVLTTDSISSHLRFELSGKNREGNTSTCGADLVQGSCSFAWDAP